MNIREELFKLKDEKYREFNSKFIPNIDKNTIIGVRVPDLRALAKKIHNNSNEYNIKDYYYEEKMLKGFLISLKKCSSVEHKIDISNFVNNIDNWAICDYCCSSFKFVLDNREEYYEFILSFLDEGEFKTRFSIVMLMYYYLDDTYIDKIIDVFKSINTKFYYVNMALAWALSIAFINYPDKITSLLSEMILSRDVQNKTIQKICDSYRVDKSTKQEIRKLKISK